MYRFALELMANRYFALVINTLMFHNAILSFYSAKFPYYFAAIFGICFKLTAKYCNALFTKRFHIKELPKPKQDEIISWVVAEVLFLVHPKELVLGQYNITYYVKSFVFMIDMVNAAKHQNYIGEIGMSISYLWRLIPTGIKPGHIASHPLSCLVAEFAGILAQQMKIDIKWVYEACFFISYLRFAKKYDLFADLSKLIFDKASAIGKPTA